jgi:MoxR-like ATPase
MITVAIDGPAGVGKSTVSKALAKHFGLAYSGYRRNVPCLHLVVPRPGHRP